MVCARCGRPTKTGDRFCGFCGYNLTVNNDTEFVTMSAMNAKAIQFDLGLLYFKDEKYEEALEIFEEIRKDQPDNLQVIDMCQQARDAINGG